MFATPAPELTAAQKVVLLALETFADYPGGTNARPGVDTLASMCGLDERTVRFALKAGQRLNLIEQTARANPKRGFAAVYRLLPPGVSTGSEDPLESASSGSCDPVDTRFNRIGMSFLPDQNVVSTGSQDPPTNTRPIQDQGERVRKSGRSPDEPRTPAPASPLQQSANGKSIHPRPRCARHAHIADESSVPPCPACRDLRLADEAAQRESAARADTHRAAIREAIDRCPDCDGFGRLDDLSDCPNHPNFRQGIARTP